MLSPHLTARPLLCALAFAVMTVNAAANEPSARQAPIQALQNRVLVQTVAFSGNRTFNEQQLNTLIAGSLGHPMGLDEIKNLAATVQSYYHDSGYKLVKVVVPAQQFADGKAVELVVLEGWLGEVEVQGNQRFSRESVISALEAGGVVSGKSFTLQEAERALTHLNRLSGVEVSSTLKPGKEVGSTDLLVEVSEASRVSGSIEANNYGSEDTGEYRLIPGLTFANLTGRGDEANVLAMTSVGDGDLWYGYVGYSLPLNMQGTKARAYFAKGNVDVGNTYRVLEIEGDNQSWGVGVSQDFVRSARSILTAEAWLESQDLEQSLLGVRTAEDNIRKLRFGLTLDNTDLYGRTLASAGLQFGLGEALGGMDDNSIMSSRAAAGADNDFSKITFDVARLQQITQRFLLIPRIAGQYTFDSLVASEQWGIGGFNSVVGHAPSTWAGDHGFTASLEGRYSLSGDSDRYQATARIDHGQVWLKDSLSDQDAHQDLTGAAIGLLARPVDSIDLRVDFAVPLSGRTEDSTYVYAQARYRF